MTDHDERESDFDDPAYDDVRGLLADARVTDPVPDDVAARLDATLAGLVAGRGTADDVPAPVPLRRRSRLAPKLLIAAAAVVLVGAGGIGLGQVLDSGGDDAGTASTADAGGPASQPELSGETPTAPQDAPAAGGAVGLGGLTADEDGLLQLTTAGFATEAPQVATREQVQLRSRLQYELTDSANKDDVGLDAGAEFSPDPSGEPGPASGQDAGRDQLPNGVVNGATKECPGPVFPGAYIVSVLLDDDPAVLVFHPITGGTQLVEARTCDGTEVLASTTLVR